jgi:IMP dehydrogenase
MNQIIETLSFDDVLISPRSSDITSRKTISLKTKLTNKISLNLPLISSPMDTITEDKMAIEMALNGGLGIIHRYNTIEQQVEMVNKVKRYLSYIITNPYTILETETIHDLLNKIKEYHVYSYLVTDEKNTLKGIVTKRDSLQNLFRYFFMHHPDISTNTENKMLKWRQLINLFALNNLLFKI